MRKTQIQEYVFSTLIFLLLSGCAKEIRITDNGISEQEAIDAALKIVLTSQPEISGSQVTPSNIHAEQMTLGEATKRISKRDNVAAGYSPDMLVWLVSMDGIWLDEFPRPENFPTPEPYQHAFIIIDAKTGLDVGVSMRP